MKKFIIPASFLAPSLVFAQTLGNLETLIRSIGRLTDIALPIVVAIALLIFFWGLVKFIFAASPEGKSDGKSFMIWGIVALFVMVSVWGLVRFVGNAFGIDAGGTIDIPDVPGL